MQGQFISSGFFATVFSTCRMGKWMSSNKDLHTTYETENVLYNYIFSLKKYKEKGICNSCPYHIHCHKNISTLGKPKYFKNLLLIYLTVSNYKWLVSFSCTSLLAGVRSLYPTADVFLLSHHHRCNSLILFGE